MSHMVSFVCFSRQQRGFPPALSFSISLDNTGNHDFSPNCVIFRYSGGPSAKEETRTADGITRGSYSYIDGHGLVQTTSYVSDPVNGFRVAATNLPVGPSPAVAAPAVIAHPAAVAGPLETPEVSFIIEQTIWRPAFKGVAQRESQL